MNNLQNFKYLGIPIPAVVASLTTSYPIAAGNNYGILDSIQPLPAAVADMDAYNELILFVEVTLDTATDVRLIIEFSPDNEQNWHQETLQTNSGTTATMTQLEHVFAANGKYIISIPIKFPRARIRAKVTGTPGSDSVKVTAAAGVH